MLIIKSNIIYSKDKDTLITLENSYIGVKDGIIEFVKSDLPFEYVDCEVEDYSDKLLIPGLCDLHTHAPQFENIGQGMDRNLLEWLDEYTFPTEEKYKDAEYARKMYTDAVNKVLKNGTTRVSFFGTVHKDSCQILVDIMREKGLRGYVGKVNMDANCPTGLIEDSKAGIEDTIEFYENNMYNKDVLPIITPRFSPSCSEKTLKSLGEIAKKYNAPIQSHINESRSEIKWVKELFPNYDYYADVYRKNNLLNNRTLMAHCIHMKEYEIKLFADIGVWAVHCPHSNCNLASGIMHIKNLMSRGIKVGFGTDVSGGNDASILKTIVYAMQMSNLVHSENADEDILSLKEAFYIATKGGGSYFGKVGSFEKGYEFDALLVDDSEISPKKDIDLAHRLERFVFCGDDRNIVKRYICGREIEV